MYIMYLEILKKLNKLSEAIMHLQFQIGLTKALIHGWVERHRVGVDVFSPKPIIHILWLVACMCSLWN